MSNTDNALKPILAALLRLLEVSELQARQGQSNHTTQLKTIETALTHGHNIDIPSTLNTLSDVITKVADSTAALVEVNNSLVKSHKEQKKSIDAMMTTFEEYVSRMDVLTLHMRDSAETDKLETVFKQIELNNLVEHTADV